MPNLISNNQNAFVANRFINEGDRLISHILEMADILNMEGYLLIIDIEKAFDSVDHHFLLAIPEKCGYKENFLRWIETLFSNQESCIINWAITTHYFKLKKVTRQGDPISAYLFILVSEAVFCVIISNKGLNIFSHEFLYPAYTDDTNFSLKDTISVFETLNILHKFSLVSGQSPNTTKWEIAGIGTLKGILLIHSVALNVFI